MDGYRQLPDWLTEPTGPNVIAAASPRPWHHSWTTLSGSLEQLNASLPALVVVLASTLVIVLYALLYPTSSRSAFEPVPPTDGATTSPSLYSFYTASDSSSKVKRRVLFLTAHPDDECMFMAPAVISLAEAEQSRRGVEVHALCLSSGAYPIQIAPPLSTDESVLIDQRQCGWAWFHSSAGACK